MNEQANDRIREKKKIEKYRREGGLITGTSFYKK